MTRRPRPTRLAVLALTLATAGSVLVPTAAHAAEPGPTSPDQIGEVAQVLFNAARHTTQAAADGVEVVQTSHFQGLGDDGEVASDPWMERIEFGPGGRTAATGRALPSTGHDTYLTSQYVMTFGVECASPGTDKLAREIAGPLFGVKRHDTDELYRLRRQADPGVILGDTLAALSENTAGTAEVVTHDDGTSTVSVHRDLDSLGKRITNVTLDGVYDLDADGVLTQSTTTMRHTWFGDRYTDTTTNDYAYKDVQLNVGPMSKYMPKAKHDKMCQALAARTQIRGAADGIVFNVKYRSGSAPSVLAIRNAAFDEWSSTSPYRYPEIGNMARIRHIPRGVVLVARNPFTRSSRTVSVILDRDGHVRVGRTRDVSWSSRGR